MVVNMLESSLIYSYSCYVAQCCFLHKLNWIILEQYYALVWVLAVRIPSGFEINLLEFEQDLSTIVFFYFHGFLKYLLFFHLLGFVFESTCTFFYIAHCKLFIFNYYNVWKFLFLMCVFVFHLLKALIIHEKFHWVNM